MKSASRSSVLENEALAKKLAKIDEELAEVARQKELLDPKKEKTHFPKKIDHNKKPKKSFTHPKLDFVYGEVAFSPYLTKPLDPYPETTFTVVEDLRELKRQGVKKINKLPKDKQPYDPKKVKKTFIDDVINYEVSFLPKGYEERKRREMELSLSMSCLDGADLDMEADGEDTTQWVRSHSPNFKEKRSQILLANIARGGPAKYLKELKALKETRTKSRVQDMAKAMLSVEQETQLRESRRRMKREEKQRAKESEEFQRRAAMEGIQNAKRTAERIFEMKVPENIRSERASSPPQLLALRRREMESERDSRRGRNRVSESLNGGATTSSLSVMAARDSSPSPQRCIKSDAPEGLKSSNRPATTGVGTRSSSNMMPKGGVHKPKGADIAEKDEEDANEVTEMTTASNNREELLPQEALPPAFVVTPMHADDGDEEGETEGNFFNYETFESVENEASPFDDIAPDVATFGSVEDNINVLRESIGIPDEVVEEVGEEGSLSAPTSRPNTGAGGGRPGTSGYVDRTGKSNGRGSRSVKPASNVPNAEEYEEDVFPEYNPSDENDVEGIGMHDLVTEEVTVSKREATESEVAKVVEGGASHAFEGDSGLMSNIAGDLSNEVEDLETTKEGDDVPLTTVMDSPVKEDQASMRFEEQSQSVPAID